MVSTALQNAGHVVDVAKNGRVALNRITEGKGYYDLLITDNNMPYLTGSELIQQICRDGFKGKIIVASSSASEQTGNTCLSPGVNRFLQKPYRMADLQLVVEELFPESKDVVVTLEAQPTFFQATRIS